MTNQKKESMVYDQETGEPLVFNRYNFFRQHTLAADPSSHTEPPEHAIHISRPDELDDPKRYSDDPLVISPQTEQALGSEVVLPLTAWLESEVGYIALQQLKENGRQGEA